MAGEVDNWPRASLVPGAGSHKLVLLGASASCRSWVGSEGAPGKSHKLVLGQSVKDGRAPRRGIRMPVFYGHVNLRIRPLTPDLWPALEDLFGERGACNGCWCMYWRIGSAYRKQPREKNKAAFRQVVKHGPPPGLIAFEGNVAVGWCQVTPRDVLPWLDRAWRLRRVDDLAVWSISCLYVRKGYRRRGITSALISAALKFAKAAGAPAVEAYPLDTAFTPSATGTGHASTFARAGFKTVGRRTPPRPIMRHDFRSPPDAAEAKLIGV